MLEYLFPDTEIEPSTGHLDLATLNQTDYGKFAYGRPAIHKTGDNNILGIRYGRNGLKGVSLEVRSRVLCVQGYEVICC